MVTHDDAVKRKAVAGIVRTHRERLGLTIVDAAHAAKVSRTTWTDIEQGLPPMKKAATLGKVAKVINIDTNVLFAAAGYLEGLDITPPAGTDPTPSWVTPAPCSANRVRSRSSAAALVLVARTTWRRRPVVGSRPLSMTTR